MKHHGLCHLQLTVSDLDRSVRFYSTAFGLELLHQGGTMAFLRTPGRHECLTLRQGSPCGPQPDGGIHHFGFPLQDAAELEAAIAEVLRAGGILLERGALEGGTPTAFLADPDGYRIQI